MATVGVFSNIWRWTKRILLILFIAQFVYIILLRWVNPPITVTQFVSWVTGHGMKRDYVSRNNISFEAKLAVIASEDQLFADHRGFDWKSIEKAMKYNERSRAVSAEEVPSASRLQKMYFCGREADISAKGWKPTSRS